VVEELVPGEEVDSELHETLQPLFTAIAYPKRHVARRLMP
jgi:hypothetical protein